MKSETIGKISKILLIIACIVFVIGLILTYIEIQRVNHNPADISVELNSVTPKIDTSGYSPDYYVYMDFEIKNNTQATLEYISVTTYLTDENGKSIGYITSTFGSYSNKLNLAPGESTVITNYLRTSGSNWGSVFEELYYNGLSNCEVESEITYVSWTDDYVWDIDG